MKKLLSLALAFLLIFSSVAVVCAQEVEVSETSVNTNIFDKIADYVVSRGTSTNSGYRVTCSYDGYSCNLFYTNDKTFQIRFSNETSKLLTSGNITYYRYTETADIYLSAIYDFYSATFTGNFNAQTFTENFDKEQLSITNINYNGDDVFKMEQLLTTSENYIETYTKMVELHLKSKLGYGISDIYNEDENSNNNETNDENINDDSNKTDEKENNTESTPDAVTPTPSTQDNAPVAPATPKTGHNTYAVAFISLMVLAGIFTLINRKKSLFKN